MRLGVVFPQHEIETDSAVVRDFGLSKEPGPPHRRTNL